MYCSINGWAYFRDITVHVTKRAPPPSHLVHTYIPIVVGLLWLVRPEQADPLHISSTREEVSNILLQNKQALQQLLWLQHQSPIGHFSGYYGYSFNLPLVWGQQNYIPVNNLVPRLLAKKTTKKTKNKKNLWYPLLADMRPSPRKTPGDLLSSMLYVCPMSLKRATE